MYAFPADFDPATLTGNTLEELLFTGSALFLRFDGDLEITVLGAVWHHGQDDADGRWVDIVEVPVRQSRLPVLIGHAIVLTRVEGRANLVLRFDNDHELKFVEDIERFECYHVETSTQQIIV